MKGVYMVFFSLEEREETRIGALGAMSFEQGMYIYTGSARNSLESRLERHFSDDKKKFWHIDYFSQIAEPLDYFVLPEESIYECRMANILSNFCEEIAGFGSSDCKCSSHLFRIPQDF